MPAQEWQKMSAELTSALHLAHPPIGITFSTEAPEGVAPFDAPMAEPAPDGRTGRVPAGCVFWMRAAESAFTTEAADHGNCSVGSLTHGLKTAEEVAGNGDVAALVESGWAPEGMLSMLPAVTGRPTHVTYGPLGATPVDPDVVMIRMNAKQLMVLSDAVPDLRIEGKPQCHIIPLATEEGAVAASVGCMLSRVRTGMSSHETACVIPAGRLGEVLEQLETTSRADAAVAAYAGEDARRFL
ncbi:MAG TPA: DUF169 domain-containing protein [Acidimicrobiales bacterium]|nr:DUF169 domain-containing protein [Acidimicrobiales bacterium]